MKKINRILSILLLLALIFSLGINATAAEPTLTGSITLNDAPNVSVSGKTFNAYKVLNATFVDGAGAEGGTAYTVPTEMASFYADRYNLKSSSDDFDQKVAEGIAAEADMYVFAREVLAAAKAAHVAPGTVTAGDGVSSVTINGLPFGYYVVEDAGAATPISALMLDTVGGVSINIKADKPSVDKKIDGSKDTDPSTSGKVDSNNAAIGDQVPYVITSNVPDMTGYKTYFFVAKDTLSQGLTFNNDVKVTVGGSDVTENVTVTHENGNLEIVFKNFIQYKAQKGAEIVITYSATINEKAVIGVVGNPNQVVLQYSNNPNKEAQGEQKNPDKPGPDDADVIGETPKKITKTFVTELQVLKQNEKGNALAGARFKLEGDRLNTVLITREVYTKSENGTYFLLKNGSYTTTGPKDETKDQYVSTTDKYIKGTKTETVTKSENVIYDGFVNDEGKLTFSGLSAGSYTLTELVAPNGYNMLKEPISITISCNQPETAAGNCTWTVSSPATAEDGIIKLTVVNTAGTELPSTGGIGTNIFYVVGISLMLTAVVLLITKKRMSAVN